MQLHHLKAQAGARSLAKRKGRGHSAGQGKQAGKGQSGQAKRAKTKKGFEGGQNPWYRRLPKRGFHNHNHLEYQIINLSDLARAFPQAQKITFKDLLAAQLVNAKQPVKLLAKGTIKHAYKISLHGASKAAAQAISAQGGTIEVL